MPKIQKKKQPEAKKPQEETPTTSSSSMTETTSKPTAAQQLAILVNKYGKAETKMLREILTVLGMDPNLEQAEEQTNEMRETLQAVLAAIEDLQTQERDRFNEIKRLLEEQLKVSREAAAAMQTVADALTASQ